MKTNIVIPCHNRLEHTKQTLESLFKNTKREMFELWVIDDKSTDGTREYLIDLMKKHDFNLTLNTKCIGPAASRNNACREFERLDYLYHSDNDVYFTDKWLEVLIGMFEVSKTKELKLLGGGCHPYLQNKETWNFRQPFEIGIKDAVSGYSQLMTWDTWDKYGPFDEGQGSQEKKIMGSEDYAFCQRIIKDGYKVGSIEPEVVIACGKTNTYGEPATGHETFKQLEGVMVK